MKKTTLKKEISHLKKLIYSKCLDCTNYQPKEIVLCPVKNCSLWKVRPQKKRGLYSLAKHLKQENLINIEVNK